MIIEKQWYQVKNILLRMLDRMFLIPMDGTTEYDSLLTHEEIHALGYVRNFPHLSCIMCSIEEGVLPDFARGQSKLDRNFKKLNADMALLPATCYKVYLSLQGQQLEKALVESCIASCFRHEDKTLDTYRALNFTMKEYVYIGTSGGARAHLESGYELLSSLFKKLGIRVDCEDANDPFFDTGGSVALLSTMTPTKRELVFNGHAVSSLNYHRNYFGEKFQIRLDDAFVHTSCVAFGLERWISMFRDHFGSSERALAALARI